MSDTKDVNFQASVEAEVARRMATIRQQLSETMEASIKSALQNLDAMLENQRDQLARERLAVQREYEKAEKEGGKLAEEYFQKLRAALIEFTQRDLLQHLAWEHLEAGKTVEDICHWLRVEPQFVNAIVEVRDRSVNYHRDQAARQRIQLTHHPRLRYKDLGRGGSITFEDDRTSFDLWWEIGSGSALAMIGIPTEQQWQARTKIPLDQRDGVLRFIAEQVVEDHASGSRFEIGNAVITILRRNRSPISEPAKGYE